MATRRFDFITGIESSSAPVATDPVNPSDPTTLGFSDERYVQGGPGVADVAALKALDVADRRDKDCILVESKNALYRYDATGTGTNDDNLIIVPTAGAGRWFKVSDIEVNGDLEVPGQLDVQGDFQALGDQFYVGGDSQFVGAVVLAGQTQFSDALHISEQITPATPPLNHWSLYPTITGFKQMDDTGAISELGGGGGSGSGELNLVSSGSSSADGWSTSVGGLTVSTNTDAANLPLEGLVASSLYIRAGSSGGSGNNINFKFSMPDALLNTKLKIEWYQKARSAYASGDLKVELWTNTLSDYTGTYVEVPLSTDSSGDTPIPALEGKFTTYFDAAGLVYYELRIVKTNGDAGGATDGVDFSNIIVGPGIQPQGAVVTEWQSYTPTFNGFGTPTNVFMQWRRIGSSVQLQGSFNAGTTTAAEARVGLPTGLTISTTSSPILVGSWERGTTNTAAEKGNVLATSGDTFFGFALRNGLSSLNGFTELNGNDISGTGNKISLFAEVSVAEWAGSGTVNLAQNDVEYAASTTGTWDAAAASTDTIYGPSGAPITGALSADRSKVVQFQTPIQATDDLILEIQTNGEWLPMSTRYPFSQQNTLFYGARFNGVSGNDTQVQVFFGRYNLATGATYGSAGGAWTSGEAWRVKKTKAGVAVGFGAGSAEAKGLVYAPLAITGQSQTGITNNTEVDIGSGTLSLPAGQYLVNFGAQPSVTFSVTPTFARMQLKVTDSSNVQLAGLINIGVGALSASTELNGTHASTQLVTLSAPTTVKIRGLINVSGGTVSSRDFFGAYAMFTRIA